MKKQITLLAFILMSTTIFSQTPNKSELININGKNIHYQVFGKGKPLFLLHGYTLSSQSWLPYVQDFENQYEVYIVDLTGHGKSDPFKEKLSIKSVAKDLNALIAHLKLDKIQAIGFSFGGDILYHLALLNPNLIESMITIGAVGTWSVNDFPEYKEAFTFENRANFPWITEFHKTDERIKALMEQFSNYIVKLSSKELQSIKPEVLIMIGDDDQGMDLTEVARVKKNLPNSDLWILPNVSHGAHEGETKDDFILKAKTFLSKKRNK
jgi:pimeloyl-ACP methyl ester carboxylesterase